MVILSLTGLPRGCPLVEHSSINVALGKSLSPFCWLSACVMKVKGVRMFVGLEGRRGPSIGLTILPITRYVCN